MLRDETVVVESSWACGAGEEPWRDLDRQLRSIATRRGALDHEELMLIREAIAMQLWRPLGMTSMREYLERRLGYGPQVAAERLRVAEALEALPAIEEALDTGELSYSAVRELTRIATRKTDTAWVKACRGKVVSEIQEMVAEREPGDPPDGKPKPLVRRRRFCADLLPDVHALLRQARQLLEAEHGEKLDNDELMRAFLARVLEPAAASEKAQRPRHQIAVTVCEACRQGWQNGAGREIPISAIDVEVALCDAQHVGSLDEPPGKLTQNIPAATRRFVWRRDHGRCRIPGCRAACFIDVHHLVPRELGGTHDVSNLALLCAGHHRALHAGHIVIQGTAPDFMVVWLTEVPHVGDSSLDECGDVEPSVEASLAESSVARSRGPHVGDFSLDDEDSDLEPLAEASLAESSVARSRGPHVGDFSLDDEDSDLEPPAEASLAEATVDRSRLPDAGDSSLDECGDVGPSVEASLAEATVARSRGPHVGDFSLDDEDSDLEPLADASVAEATVDRSQVPHVGDFSSDDAGAAMHSAALGPAVRVASVPHVGHFSLDDEDADLEPPADASVAEATVDRSRLPHVGDLLPDEAGAAMHARASRPAVRVANVPYAGDFSLDDAGAAMHARASRPAMHARASRPAVRVANVPHVGDPTSARSDLDEQNVADVLAGLVRLGFRRNDARGAVARAHAQVGRGADIETLLRAALRECPRTS